ncbi:MAG: hypothetical protein R8M38_03155 [Mariprofundaceae bacterium]
MMKKTVISAACLVLMTAFSASAFAGGVTVAKDGDSKLKIEGKFFLNATARSTEENGETTKESIGLGVDRAYLGVKYYFNKDWMVRITTDVGHDSALKKQNNIYLKYAYVEGKLAGKAAVLRLGQSHTPWIDYEQGLWKHRYVSKVMVDQYKYDSSSDLGIGLKGTVADGLVKYWVTETTGMGYGKGNQDKNVNAMDFDSRIGIYPVKGLTLDFQYRNGYKGSKVYGSEGSTKHALYQVMATYGMGKVFRVGANYLSNKQTPDGSDSTTDSGFSVWAWANIPGTDFGAFGRYENVKDDSAVEEETARYVGGLEYTPIKNVSFSLVVDSKTITNSKNVAGDEKKSQRYGLYSQVKF